VDESVPGGANLTLEILRQVLVDLDGSNSLPTLPSSTFYLQVDNCGENKNRTMLAFLTDLVKRGVFLKVKLGFLMVGHTHEDIDQFFSVIAKHLRKIDVICADQPSLFKAIEEAFAHWKDRPVVKTFSATSMFDYVEWYGQLIDPELHYFQEPHVFRIKKFRDPNAVNADEVVTLLHYKMWVESAVWLPEQHVDNLCTSTTQPLISDSGNASKTDSSIPQSGNAPRKRTMSRGSITKGQNAARIRQKMNHSVLVDETIEDIPENIPYLKDASILLPENHSNSKLQGILLIEHSPNLEAAKHVQFSAEQVQTNLKRCQMIFSAIVSKFVPNYRNIFSEAVMENWQNWLCEQEKIWDLEYHQAHPAGFISFVAFPRSLLNRAPSRDQNTLPEVEDCALADLEDHVQFVTHSSGAFGAFTRKERLEMIRLSLAEIEKRNSNIMVLENMGCIYKFVHEAAETKEEKTQIALGLVEKVHTNSESNESTFDIRFCPPRGAKPAGKNRPDSLYQNISADMHFNLKYRSKKGKKVENEDKKLPREVMLAFNLDMNKDGTISKRRMTDSPYNMSSYALVHNVISEFYSSSFEPQHNK
jgi:hypothetical protein